MTLREMIEAHPDLFYLNNRDWFWEQAFMDREADVISSHFWLSEVAHGGASPHAADLAALYLLNPHETRWKKFMWTDDVDVWGNRVYVSGVGHDGCAGFQIHRHLQPACYWVSAS